MNERECKNRIMFHNKKFELNKRENIKERFMNLFRKKEKR